MLLPFCTNLILPGFLRKLLRVELWTENRFDEICDFVMIFDIIWYWNPWKVGAKTVGRWGWLQEDRHKATAVVDPGNRWRGVWWRSRSKKSFQYEEKEGPTTCIYYIYNVYILWHIHIPSIPPFFHLYNHRCLHFTAQVSQRFLPNDSRLSPGGLPSFFSQREICHQLRTTDLEHSVSDVGSVDLLRIWFWLALPWTHQKVICSVETGRGSGSLPLTRLVETPIPPKRDQNGVVSTLKNTLWYINLIYNTILTCIYLKISQKYGFTRVLCNQMF